MLPLRYAIKTRQNGLKHAYEVSNAPEKTTENIQHKNKERASTGEECLLRFYIKSVAKYMNILGMKSSDGVLCYRGNMWRQSFDCRLWFCQSIPVLVEHTIP